MSITTSNEDMPPPIDLGPDPQSLVGTECKGAGTTFAGPFDLYNQPVPESWASGSTQGFTFVNHYSFTCHRLSWGQLERPVSIMLEGHQSFSPPESCMGPRRTNYLLATAWWDDVDANQMALAVGMTTRLGAFNRTTELTQGVELDTLAWSLDGEQQVLLRYANAPPQLDTGTFAELRFFWFNGTGVSYLDLDSTYAFDQLQPPPVVGEFGPATFYGSIGNPLYVGAGETFQDSPFSAKISVFRDLLCKEPW